MKGTLVVGITEVLLCLDLHPTLYKFNWRQEKAVDQSGEHTSLHRMAKRETSLALDANQIFVELVGGEDDGVD